MNQLQVLSSDPEHCLARFGGVQIQLWRTGVPLFAARLARAKARELPAGAERALLIVVEGGGKPPEGEARTILTELGTKMDGAVGCAFVSEGQGFMAATMRGVMTSMSLLVRPQLPRQGVRAGRRRCSLADFARTFLPRRGPGRGDRDDARGRRMSQAPAMQLVRAEAIGVDAYAPFGALVAARAEAPRVANHGDAEAWDDLAELVNERPERARPTVSLFRCAALSGSTLDVRWLERHPRSTQMFVPMRAGRYLVVVAHGDETPDSGFAQGVRGRGLDGDHVPPRRVAPPDDRARCGARLRELHLRRRDRRRLSRGAARSASPASAARGLSRPPVSAARARGGGRRRGSPGGSAGRHAR